MCLCSSSGRLLDEGSSARAKGARSGGRTSWPGSLSRHVVTACSRRAGTGTGARAKQHRAQPKLLQAAETPGIATSTAPPLERGEPSSEECRWRPADPKGGQITREIQNLPAKTRRNFLNAADKTFRCDVLRIKGGFSEQPHCSRVSLLSWDKTCARAVSGQLTCSNKTLFFSPVNVATAGCLGSLPGKKKSAHITLNRCRGQM